MSDKFGFRDISFTGPADIRDIDYNFKQIEKNAAALAGMEMSASDVPGDGVKTHYHITDYVSGYVPKSGVEEPPEPPIDPFLTPLFLGDDETASPGYLDLGDSIEPACIVAQ